VTWSEGGSLTGGGASRPHTTDVGVTPDWDASAADTVHVSCVPGTGSPDGPPEIAGEPCSAAASTVRAHTADAAEAEDEDGDEEAEAEAAGLTADAVQSMTAFLPSPFVKPAGTVAFASVPLPATPEVTVAFFDVPFTQYVNRAADGSPAALTTPASSVAADPGAITGEDAAGPASAAADFDEDDDGEAAELAQPAFFSVPEVTARPDGVSGSSV